MVDHVTVTDPAELARAWAGASRSKKGDLMSISGGAAMAVTLNLADWCREQERSQEADEHERALAGMSARAQPAQGIGVRRSTAPSLPVPGHGRVARKRVT